MTTQIHQHLYGHLLDDGIVTVNPKLNTTAIRLTHEQATALYCALSEILSYEVCERPRRPLEQIQQMLQAANIDKSTDVFELRPFILSHVMSPSMSQDTKQEAPAPTPTPQPHDTLLDPDDLFA